MDIQIVFSNCFEDGCPHIPALPGRFAVVQAQIFYSVGLIAALTAQTGLG